ncbi:hypothetical protein [Streptomyces griseosporeus]
MARRGTNSKGLWAAGALGATVLVLTGYALLSSTGSDDSTGRHGASPGASSSVSASPGATYAAPEDWTEPEHWAALPRGERTDKYGSAVGFPHTLEGAVAMMAAANTTSIEAGRSTVDEQLRIYHSYVAPADQSSQNAESIELQAMQTDKSLHQEMSVSAGQPLPAGAYVRSNVVGYKVVAQSPDEVSVWLLSRVVQKSGETAKESSSYTRVLNGARWVGGDWKLSGAVTKHAMTAVQGKAQPPMVAPGDAAFNEAGWVAIRAAS